MSATANLWLFFLLVLGVIVLPGMDMAFVLASALAGGRRAGMAAVGGIVVGGICHVVMGVAGITVLLAVAPAAFDAMLLAGAAYVAWIGIALLRGGVAASEPATAAPSAARCFRRAVVTCLLNPKAYVFMLAVFPQFLRPTQGHLFAQAALLSAIIAATQAAVYGGLALVAARARGWLAGHPSGSVLLGRGVGVLLVAAAVVTGVQGWRAR